MKSCMQPRLFLLMASLAVVLPAAGQIPGMPSKAPPAETLPAGESAEAMEARLQKWLVEARQALARVNEEGAETRLPEGIGFNEFSDYRRDLEQTLLGITRHQKNTALLPEARKAVEAMRARDAAWTGFADPPPYSVLMIDELVNQQDAVREKASSSRSSLELVERSLSTLQDEARAGEEANRKLLAQVEEKGPAVEAAKWRLTAHRTKSRLFSVRATYLRSSIALFKENHEAANIEMELLERQIAHAKRNPVFRDEDLAKVQKAAADRLASLRKEIAVNRKREQEAITFRGRSEAKVQQLTATLADGEDPNNSAELVLAKLELETAKNRVESVQFAIEKLELMTQLEPSLPEAYQDRKTILTAALPSERKQALNSMRSSHDRMRAWATVIGNDLAAIKADIDKQEAQSALLAADDPRLLPIHNQRATLWEKQAMMQRLSQAISSQRRLLKRWLGEFETAPSAAPARPTLASAFSSFRQSIKNIWRFPVFYYDDTVMMGGVPSTEKRAVPLGKVFIAIVFFFTAYFIASRIKNRLQRAVVSRGRIAEAQANTLSNWLMIAVGLLLALTTLHFLRIPLTVFAFLGGALAIGLGFGSQTLIKNFISGIIVLFERKIRVGDVVEVGLISGTIVEINTRSSVLSSPDGRETLVPNSVFLETSVTNLTLANRVVRRFILVGVAYGTPVDLVSKVLAECTARHGLIRKEPAPLVIFQDFADSALVFKLYFWIEMDGKTSPELVESDLRMIIAKAFQDAKISFPYPQRDLHFKTNEPLQISLTQKEN
jgi:potassium efflux system protein